jgi:hypothetical protein
MNEDILRTSLDQSLLAVSELDGGDIAKAQAHATLAGALAPLVGDRSDDRAMERALDRATRRWITDIRSLSPVVLAPVGVEPGTDPLAALPGRATGRERAMLRREERLQSRS